MPFSPWEFEAPTGMRPSDRENASSEALEAFRSAQSAPQCTRIERVHSLVTARSHHARAPTVRASDAAAAAQRFLCCSEPAAHDAFRDCDVRP
jgi:hypothetical protein